MDWLEFFATTLKTLVWPGFVLLLVVLFYPQLRDLAAHVKTLKAGASGVEVTVGEAEKSTDAAAAAAKALHLTPEDHLETVAALDIQKEVFLPSHNAEAARLAACEKRVEHLEKIADRRRRARPSLPADLPRETATALGENPANALDVAWRDLDNAITRALGTKRAPRPRPEGFAEALDALDEVARLPPSFYLAVEKLRAAARDVRNGATVDAATAQTFVRQALRLEAMLDSLEAPR
ncbi:MAG: hypothetical protein QOE90_3277 [Thermoplasmata archaeon]|jgi:hypothetical protein|nr:hypothetical protein [Thermoplasmata archaeon]